MKRKINQDNQGENQDFGNILRRFVYLNNYNKGAFWNEEEILAEKLGELLKQRIIKKTELELLKREAENKLSLKDPRLLYNLIVAKFLLSEDADCLTRIGIKFYPNNMRFLLARYCAELIAGNKEGADRIKNKVKMLYPVGEENYIKNFFNL